MLFAGYGTCEQADRRKDNSERCLARSVFTGGGV
ncbi:MAG: hypothetical protein RLY85_1281 [Bacteroidota bacterium]